MATGVGDIFLDLKLNKQPFEKGLNETKATASLAGRKIGLAIAGAIAGAVGAVGFSALVSSTAKLGDAIDKTSQKMGMSAQAYQEWDFIMQRCGTSMDSMTMAMKTLASSAITSKDALAELGISQEEVASLSQEQLFARTISALQNVEDTTRRTYLAGQLLGRGATELGAVLNMSASETDQLRQRVYELGGVMSQEAVTASAQYTDAMLDLKMAFRGISDTVAVSVLPIITSAINKVIIPIILRAVAVVRYFGNILRSAFGGLGAKIKGVFGGKAQKQNIDFGKSIGGVSKGIGGAGKSAKKAKKAVKELNRELMGFDKMNKLAKKNKASDAGGAGGGAGGAGGIGGIGDMGEALGGANNKLGIFSKLSEKLRPIWKALGDVFKAIIRLFKAVGKALAPVGKWIWEHLIKPFGKLLGMAIVAVLEGIAGAIDMVASFIEKHPKVSVILMGIGTALLLLIKRKAVVGVLKGIGKAFKVFGGAIAGNWVALLLIAIALAIGYIYKNWDKIKKTKFGKALIKVGNTLKKVGGILKEKLIGAFNKLKPILKFVGNLIWKSIVARFKLMVGAVKLAWAVLKKVGSFFKGAFKKAVEAVSKPVTALKDAWAGIKSKTVDLKAKIGEGLDNAGELLSGLGDNLKDVTVDIKAQVATKWDDIKGAWNSLTGNVKDITAKFFGAVGTVWSSIKDAWGNLTGNIKDITASFFAKIGTAWSSLKDAWGNITNNIKDKTADMKAKVASKWSDLKETWNNLIGHFKDVTASIKVSIKKVAGAGWNAFAKKVNAMKKAHPKIFKLVPTLPKLAQGGWVGKNTPQLAVVGDNRHESEIVAPDSKLMAMARQASQEAVRNSSNAQVVALLSQLLVAVQNQNTNVYLDGKEITRNTVKNINQQTRTTGRSPILV